ncbi:DNA-3-methyladenine glycosylase 2 family protein [Arthrobacter sp. TMN-49]
MERYRAIDARDVRFDGQFFTAVSSTGIYCRPSCPARTPKPENVTFYPTSAAAQTAGFRACKRCFPEATPGTPEWNLRHDLAARAMRLILDGTVDREGVDGLASRLGYSARHIHRVLISQLGSGPLSLARARRAQSARALIVDSDLALADVAFAAGFGSVRQFNITIQEVFAASPNELRVRFRKPLQAEGLPDAAATPSSLKVRLKIDLPVRQPFDALGVFHFLAARAVNGMEVADLRTRDHLSYARTLILPGGAGAVEVTATRIKKTSWRVCARLELVTLSDVAPAIARVRRMLDLDADPVAVDTALRHDPELAQLVERTPGIRVPGAVDPHELVVRALVGQQISVAAARTHLGRFAAHSGSTYVSSIPGLTRLFPTIEQIITALPEPAADEPLDPDRPLRLPGQAIRALLAICHAMQSGELTVDVGVDADRLRGQLISWPRIGDWTASYIAMRVLGDPDAWLYGDAALIAGAKNIGILKHDTPKATNHRALADRATQWSPWRSYASMHLWQAATLATTNSESSKTL